MAMWEFIFALFAPVVEPRPVDMINDTGLATFWTGMCGLGFRPGALSDMVPPFVHQNVGLCQNVGLFGRVPCHASARTMADS